MKHYFEKGYERLDPVITYCQSKMELNCRKTNGH